MPMTEATRLREPMMRVPVFKEAHEQQFGSFGRATILKMYLKLLEGIQLKGAIREAFALQKCSFLTLFKRLCSGFMLMFRQDPTLVTILMQVIPIQNEWINFGKVLG